MRSHICTLAPKPGPKAGILSNKTLAFLLPPTARNSLNTSWDGGLQGPQVPKVPGPNVSLHADTYLGSQWFLGGQGKELKVQLAAMGLNVNAATITRALGGIMSFSETQFPYLQKE